jgi:NAD(P)H-dependent FMN reductase
MKFLLLVGSGDVASHSYGLGKAIQAQLIADGAECELINLSEYGLPLYTRGVERDKKWDNKTQAFLDKSYAADGFVWVTPIYHNSFSGILKNALDWQHSKFPDKVVGFASNGGNRSPQAVDQLMLVARAQHLHSARVRICTQESDFDDDKQLTEPAMLARTKEFCDELVSLAKKAGKS